MNNRELGDADKPQVAFKLEKFLRQHDMNPDDRLWGTIFGSPTFLHSVMFKKGNPFSVYLFALS